MSGYGRGSGEVVLRGRTADGHPAYPESDVARRRFLDRAVQVEMGMDNG